MLRFYLALYMAKIARIAIKVLGKITKSEGTNFPGTLAMKICPDFLDRVAKPEIIACVTGTNGKTTLCNMLSDILEDNNYSLLSNKYGSNLDTGLATSLAIDANLGNKARSKIAVFEVDERSAIRVYPHVKPDYLVCTQLTRDSNRRNAHPYYIADIINQGLPDTTKLVLNADDIISSNLKPNNPRVYYGVGKLPGDSNELRNIINDVQLCPNCHDTIEYDYVRYNHIGKFHCPHCGLTSPASTYEVTSVDYNNRRLKVTTPDEVMDLNLVSDSIFNLYDEIAAIAFLKDIGLSTEKLAASLDKTQIVSSRYLKETVEGIDIVSNMAKGQVAAACSVAFDYVSKQPGDKELVIIIEDAHNAGKSSEPFMYIYDTDFEFLNKEDIINVVAVGVRSQDLCLRMMMAGMPEEKLKHVKTVPEITNQLLLKPGTSVYILYDNYEVAKNFQTRELIKERLHSRTKSSSTGPNAQELSIKEANAQDSHAQESDSPEGGGRDA